MSLNVNLSSSGIRDAYEKVLDGAKDYLVLTYEKASNDLRVQVVENGDLDDLNEEFSDGRIQYAFARVKDPNTQCPSLRSSTGAVKVYLRTAKPLCYTLIGGSSVSESVSCQHQTRGRKGTSIRSSSCAESQSRQVPTTRRPARRPTPIREVQWVCWNELQAHRHARHSRHAEVSAQGHHRAVGSNYASKRDELQQIRSGTAPTPQLPSAPRVNAPAFDSAPAPAPAPKPAAPPAPTAPTPKPAPVTHPSTAPRPEASSAPPKPAEDDRIQPVGTAYHLSVWASRASSTWPAASHSANRRTHLQPLHLLLV